jgi:hypothetical protein
MNSWDWANIFRALTPIVAPPVVVVPAPTVIVVPAPVAPAATGVDAVWDGSNYILVPTGSTEADKARATLFDKNGDLIKPVATPYADQKYREQFGDSASIGIECEEKPYIQYKDEFKVFGDNATIAQMCQIKAGTTLACDRELTKIMLVLKAADISIEGCSE